MALAEYRCSDQAAVAVGILGDEVTVDEGSSTLLFFLSDGSNAGKRIVVSDRRTETDSERL